MAAEIEGKKGVKTAELFNKIMKSNTKDPLRMKKLWKNNSRNSTELKKQEQEIFCLDNSTVRKILSVKKSLRSVRSQSSNARYSSLISLSFPTYSR